MGGIEEVLIKKIIQKTRMNKQFWDGDVYTNFLKTEFDAGDEFKEPIIFSLSQFGLSLHRTYLMEIYSKARKLDKHLNGDEYEPLRKFAEEMFVD